ncbi:hypothetical protein GG344DRAFT_80328 [Lentinula edodes]|nr:hypothetical protein GG344DRAFT_80328 [Lentinula edodes]
MQVGNGDFAFGADVTSLQTFLPFATMSSWGWKNDSPPPNRTMEDVHNYKGESRCNHGRLVQYDFGGDPEIEQWLTADLNRKVSESNLSDVHQTLDLWTGIMSSEFTYEDTTINVTTTSAQDISAITVTVTSLLLSPNTSNPFTRLGTTVKNNLAPLPIQNKVYIDDLPSLVGLHGWLPPKEGLDLGIAKVTMEEVWARWNFSNCWGWDFPMLAMSAARNNDTEKAIE